MGVVAHYHVDGMLWSCALERDETHEQYPEQLKVLCPVLEHIVRFVSNVVGRKGL